MEPSNSQPSQNQPLTLNAADLLDNDGDPDREWVQWAYIKASNTEKYDHFGSTVAFSADGATLAVSTIYESSAATGINGDHSNNSSRYASAVYLY